MAQHGETRNYVLEAELKMDASKTLTVDFLTMLTISVSLFFDRIAKHGIICVTDTFSVSNIWRMFKIP